MKNVYKYLTVLIVLNMIALSGFSQYNNAYRIKITGNGFSDETVIRLVNGATSGFDGMYDAWKLFSSNPNVPSIYTQVAPGQNLSINSLPEYSEDKSITLYTNIPVSGSYIIEVEEIYALSPNYKVSLTDVSSNTHTRLMADTTLVYNLTAQQNSPTFTFNISTPLTSAVTDETCSSMNDGSLEINNPGNNDWDLEILDANGNSILTSTSNTALNNYNNLAPGNYTAIVSSLGIEDEINFTVNAALLLTAEFNLDKDTVYLSEGGIVNITNASQNAQSYSWDMGDGGTSIDENPSHTYSSVGDFLITLTSENVNCTTQNVKSITVLLSSSVITSVNTNNKGDVKLATLGNGNYKLITDNYTNKKISVYDIKGSLVHEADFSENEYNLSLTNNNSGMYILTVIAEDGQLFQEKIIR